MAETTERVEKAGTRLAEATEKRQNILKKIQHVQQEIDSLARRGMRRPRDKLSELDDRLRKLERDRTIVSLPLKQEKEILWQISRAEKLKRQVIEFEAFDKTIKAKKAEKVQLREQLKQSGEHVSELRVELSMLKKAAELGCTVEELLGMKVECPPEKIGALIGKKGQNVKMLQEKENVSIDVGREDGAVKIIGSLKSLDAAALNIDRVLAVQEESFEFPKPLVSFLTSKGIHELADIRSRHPDVEIEMTRSTGQTRFRGVPDDIQSAKTDIESVEIVEEKMTMTSAESATLVGKQGATIHSLVEKHQAAITVSRTESEEDVEEATVVVVGSIGSVTDCVGEIHDVLAQSKEEAQNISVDPLVKEILLENKGVGIQALFKTVNDGCRGILPGVVGVSIEDLAVKVKGKSLVMDKATEIVSDELRLLEASVVRLDVPTKAIPALIGKNGSGIKKLKEGTQHVIVEVDGDAGQVAVAAFDNPEGTQKVLEALRNFIENNQVRAVELRPQTFTGQFRMLSRSKQWKELTELVSVSRDDELFQINLRGTEENLKRASDLLVVFMEEHYQDEVSVTTEDLGVLLRGGKKCKIEALAKEYEVKLNSDADRSVVVVTGKQEKVEEAKKGLDSFLNGGRGLKVARIVVDDTSAAFLVGRGGKGKEKIEAKFPTVSLSIPPSNTVVIRGPERDVDDCHKHVMRLLTVFFTSETVSLDEKTQRIVKSSSFRGQLKLIPVQANIEQSKVTIRGCRADVFYTLALVKDVPGSAYENRVFLEASCFQQLQKASRDSHLPSIQNATRTKISVDPASSSIIVSGSREHVATAKAQLFEFLLFLLSGSFRCESVPEHALNLLCQPSQLGDIAEKSGAFMYIDRDANSLIITSSNASFTAKAEEILQEKISSFDSSVYKLDLGADADWLVPRLIGKGGARIKALRKSLACTVEIDDKCITLMSEDPEKLPAARNKLDEVVAEERAQCFVAELSDDDMSAFVGQKGAHIRAFEKSHDVRAQAVREKRNSLLRITGTAEAVSKGKAAFEVWQQERGSDEIRDDVVFFEFEDWEGLILRRLIGKNGSRINSLRKQSKCQIEVNVDKRILKITSSDTELREAAKQLIEQTLEEERSHNTVVHLPERSLPAFIGAKGAHIQEFEKLHDVRVQVLKTDGGGLHIAGDPEPVANAKIAIEEWLADWTAGTTPSTTNDDPGTDGEVKPAPDNTNDEVQQQKDASAGFPALAQDAEAPSLEGGINLSVLQTINPESSWASVIQNPPQAVAPAETPSSVNEAEPM